MIISKSSLQRLVQTIGLPEHMKRFLILKRSGNNWLGVCPFHQDSTPSLYVYSDHYHCFACKAHGNIIDYEIHRLGISFKECVEKLAAHYSIQLEYDNNQIDSSRSKILSAQRNLLDFFSNLQKACSENWKRLNERSAFPLVQALQEHFPFIGLCQKNTLKEIYQKASNPNNLLENVFFSHKEFETAFKLGNLPEACFTLPVFRSQGDIQGLCFFPCENKESTLENFEGVLPWVVSASQKTALLLNWREGKSQYPQCRHIVFTNTLSDGVLLKKLGVPIVGVAFTPLDQYAEKVLSKSFHHITLVQSHHNDGKAYLWKTFLQTLSYQQIKLDILTIPDNNNQKQQFFQNWTEEKLKQWLLTAEKIPLKVTEIFIQSIPLEKNRLQNFTQKILPIIKAIPEKTKRESILKDISKRFFNNTDLSIQKISPHIELEEKYIKNNENDKNSILPYVDIMSRAADFYHHCLTQNAESSKALSYLNERGIEANQIKKWKLGYCSSKHLLSKKAQLGVVPFQDLNRLGLVKASKKNNSYYDFFSNRIIIPIENHQGKTVALAGRTLDKVQTKGDFYNPKYINSPESEIFSKSKILYHYHQASEAIIKQGFVIVVEGYMDCISLVNAGIKNVVAVMGTALTSFHLDELSKLTSRIVLCFDSDAAGQSAARRSFAASCKFHQLSLECLTLSEFKDPDEFIKNLGAEAFLQMAKDSNKYLFETIFLWTRLQSPDDQEFTKQIHEILEPLFDAQSPNDKLWNNIKDNLKQNYELNLSDFHYTYIQTVGNIKTQQQQKILTNQETTYYSQWSIKNTSEIKLLMSLLFCSLETIPKRLRHVLLGEMGADKNDETICAQAIEEQFSEQGFQIFLEISAWLIDNPLLSLVQISEEELPDLSEGLSILLAFATTRVKTLIKYQLQELLKEGLSHQISMIVFEDIWHLKNSGFLKFLLRNIKLARDAGVLSNYFAEELLKLELDHIDHKLRIFSSLHFDNEVDAVFRFYVGERTRRVQQFGVHD